MSFSSYGNYKDTNVAELGEVPAHWNVVPLKHVVETPITDGPHETPEFIDDGIPFVSAEAVSSGEINFSKSRFISHADHHKYSKKYKPRRDDIFMVKSGATTGVVALVSTDRDFNIWSPLAVVRCSRLAFPRYVLQTMRSRNFQESVILNWSFGTQQNIGMSVIENLRIPLPPIPEQNQIARFLDHETARIDALIEEQQRLIELLKEKRQGVISLAVTKGLDPTVPMKDSGVEWLGEVPAHWSSIQLGRVCRKVSDGPHFSPNYVDEGVMFLSARNIAVDGWQLDDAKFVSEEDYLEFCRRIVPEKGDVLYTKGGTTGIARVVDLDDKFQVWVHVAVLKLDREQVDPYYMAFSLNSIGCYEQSQLHTRGATNQDLGLTRMIKIWFALPPREEQVRICDFLSMELSTIDDLIAEAATVIGLLGERRSALISAAVTGKIDVRGWQPPASAPTPELVQEAV